MPIRSTSQSLRRRRLKARLIRALASCGTEADIVQLLHSELRPVFGYDPIALQVLEREGWYHHLAIDHGLLQDLRRRRLSESIFEPYYKHNETVVSYPRQTEQMVTEEARGPGLDKIPQTVIWVPISLHGRVIGAVAYQLYARRQVPALERNLLEEVHAHMGVVVNSAFLNELTRNQAVSLGALNAIARALSATHDESDVVVTLRDTIGALLPIDQLALAVLNPDTAGPPRLLGFGNGTLTDVELDTSSPDWGLIRRVVSGGRPLLADSGHDLNGYPSVAWVPIKEGGQVSAVLSVRSKESDAYEHSTLLFLQQVADQVGLALRNAWSYASLERQANHLEVANAALQRERRRLEILHVLETGVAGATDERQITEALFHALHGSVDSSGLLLVYPDARGQLTGFVIQAAGSIQGLPPKPIDRTTYFKRLSIEGRTLVESTPPDLRGGQGDAGWSLEEPRRWPAQVAWVPLL
nr:GAF domain-containing protein [Actinomycetota bacterium]